MCSRLSAALPPLLFTAIVNPVVAVVSYCTGAASESVASGAAIASEITSELPRKCCYTVNKRTIRSKGLLIAEHTTVEAIHQP